MPEKSPRTRRKKPISLILVVIETGEATPITSKVEAEILRGACNLLEDRADAMDPPPRSGD